MWLTHAWDTKRRGDGQRALEAEAGLRAEPLAAVLEDLADPVVELDDGGRCVRMNPRFAALLQAPETASPVFLDLVHPEDQPYVQRALRLGTQSHRPWAHRLRMRAGAGRWISYLAVAEVLLDDTASVRTRLALLAAPASERAQSVGASLAEFPVGLAQFDADGVILETHGGLARELLSGPASRGTAPSVSLLEALPASARPLVERSYVEVMSGRTSHCRFNHAGRSYLMTLYPVAGEAGLGGLALLQPAAAVSGSHWERTLPESRCADAGELLLGAEAALREHLGERYELFLWAAETGLWVADGGEAYGELLNLVAKQAAVIIPLGGFVSITVRPWNFKPEERERIPITSGRYLRLLARYTPSHWAERRLQAIGDLTASSPFTELIAHSRRMGGDGYAVAEIGRTSVHLMLPSVDLASANPT